MLAGNEILSWQKATDIYMFSWGSLGFQADPESSPQMGNRMWDSEKAALAECQPLVGRSTRGGNIKPTPPDPGLVYPADTSPIHSVGPATFISQGQSLADSTGLIDVCRLKCSDPGTTRNEGGQRRVTCI